MITEHDRRTVLDPPPDATPPRRSHGGRRRAAPSARAVVGGLLVAAAAVGSIAVASSGGEPATIPVVVASAPIEPGRPLGPENLEVAEMALPSQLVESTFDDPAALRGTVSRSRLEPGELLQDGDVVASTAAQRAAAPSRELSLRLDAHRVVAGRLEPGDTVDVLATYGTGRDATTSVVLVDATVLAVETADDRIAGSRTVLLTVALDRRADTIALAHAIDAASINVVRTTTASDDDTDPVPFSPSSDSADVEGDEP